MIACETFRATFAAGTEDAAILEHLRACDPCLDLAAHEDPDVMFRALGGSEMIPPGGVEAFVDDVMRQVRVRDAEKQTLPPAHVVSWPRRLAIAATLAAGITSALLMYRGNSPVAAPAIATRQAIVRTAAISLTTKPVVETYDSADATIVEVPSTDDTQIVMIFDESLPADL
jgi:anti-sigma factor RsiW